MFRKRSILRLRRIADCFGTDLPGIGTVCEGLEILGGASMLALLIAARALIAAMRRVAPASAFHFARCNRSKDRHSAAIQ